MSKRKRKLEWACREIEHLHKEVSMLKNPEFWRLEASRQARLPVGDPCRTMSDEDIARFMPKLQPLAVGPKQATGQGVTPDPRPWVTA